jgi:SSS family solute:Na+ symporter
MQLHPVDITIVLAYLVTIIVAGLLLSRRAARDIDSYFLGGKSIPWYYLGVANASGMFDITGTMWMVALLFVYGLKSAWIPWLWPTFNQIFLMIYLSVWLRRSNVMTGAEWIRTRFGNKLGGELSHISVVIFALVSVIAFLAYAFAGIGKFAIIFFPWELSANQYALILMGITTIYVILGGMYSVVLTDLIQFAILTVAAVFITWIAMASVTPEALAQSVPAGWHDLFFGWRLQLDWSGLLDEVNTKILGDGHSLFGIFFMMILLKGILSSIAGPAPNYDMQKVLSTRTPKEAALMSCCTSSVLLIPRYLLITGIGVLAIVHYHTDPEIILNAQGTIDFELILPFVIGHLVPVGLVGLMLAGLLAAFMSTFDCTVNSGASYVVNDIYKRYIDRNAPPRRYVYMSYVASLAVVVIGVGFGFFVESIDSILKWITAGLGAGYIAANVLKWHWWRLNGYGYFAGMIAGIGLATFAERAVGLVLPGLCHDFAVATDNFPLVLALFPLVVVVSTLAAVVTSLLTPPDDDQVLTAFYRQVRPWGFWGPVHRRVVREHPEFRPNTAFRRDMVNVAVGIVWQMSLIVLPIYFVIRAWRPCGISLFVLVATSIFLKINWYNKLEDD